MTRPRHLLALLAACGGLLVASAPASADSSGLPVSPPASSTALPPGFTVDAAQAVTIAKRQPAIEALHAREHPLFFEPMIWAGRRWSVSFAYRGTIDGDVDIGPSGRVQGVWTGPLARAVYARGNFSPRFDAWWVVVPFSLLFLVPFLRLERFDLRRPWRSLPLDGLLVLSLLVSYGLFDHGHLEAAVWLAYPPLLVLLLRLLDLSRRRSPRPRIEARERVPLALLAGGLLVIVVARTALSLLTTRVVDVGYASVVGAERVLHGLPIYWPGAQHGDTYGPLAYLAYLPFAKLFGWSGRWDSLPAAHVATVCFDLVTIIALAALGTRLRPGRAGWRLGLKLAWAWAACPFTLLAVIMHTNDGLVPMLSVLALLAFGSASARGGLLALGASAKFGPAALLPLFAAGRRPDRRSVLICALSFAVVCGGVILLYLPPGGLGAFYRETIGFQLSRADVFSPWALHPALQPAQRAAEVLAVLLALAVAVVPRGNRSLAQVAALSGAVTIALQMTVSHWFYYYIVWFVPFVLLAALAPAEPAVTSVLPEEPDVERGVADRQLAAAL